MQGHRPRDLRDISHLYLSTSRTKREGIAAHPALVLLASVSSGPWRAYMSAGLAAAFESHGAAVTVLETGPGLPCAGYYFALEPGRYLKPALDDRSIVEAEAGRSIGLVYARDPALLIRPERDRSIPGRPVVMLLSFDWQRGEGPGNLGEMLDSIPALRKRDGGMGRQWADLPAFLLTVSSSGPYAAENTARTLRELFPGAPGMSLFSDRQVESKMTEQSPCLDPCPFPHTLSRGMARRVPPSSDFLSGLAGELLQRLGSRRGGRQDDG
jgi:hypothetical protein